MGKVFAKYHGVHYVLRPVDPEEFDALLHPLPKLEDGPSDVVGLPAIYRAGDPTRVWPFPIKGVTIHVWDDDEPNQA